MGEKDLVQNTKYVDDNQEKLLGDHPNKFLLIYEGKLIDAFDNYETAASEGIRQFGSDAPFLVHHMVSEEPVNFVMSAIL